MGVSFRVTAAHLEGGGGAKGVSKIVLDFAQGDVRVTGHMMH
jgi:hypothetical protein